MRITYLHDLCTGDSALNHVRQFFNAAEALEHSILVGALEASDGGSDATTHDRSTSLASSVKNRLRFPLHEPKRLMRNIPWYLKARSLIREQQPDVVLIRSSLLTFGPVLAALREGYPVVLEVNSPAAESRQYFDQYYHLPRIAELVERWRLERVQGATAVSSALKDFLVENHPIHPDKIAVVPNGADLDSFRPETRPDPHWSDVVGKGTTIGFIGSFKKWHGPELLRDMVLRVGETRPETRFIMVGDGPGRGEVEQALRPLASRVVFTGRVPHARIPGVTALLDIAVMPESNFYGSPLKVIEWMAAGRAIVAPDYGPLCEIIESGREGMLFGRGNLDELVDAVVQLVDNPSLRKRLGNAAHQRAVRSLSWRHNAEKVIGACQRAIEANSRDQSPYQ